MTVHAHKSITSISAGSSTITQESGIAELATSRTWAFEAPPDVEQRVIDDVALTGRTAASVPTTTDETLEEQAADRRSSKDVADMAIALKDLVNERRDNG
jgi:hypothetical protein